MRINRAELFKVELLLKYLGLFLEIKIIIKPKAKYFFPLLPIRFSNQLTRNIRLFIIELLRKDKGSAVSALTSVR